MVQPPAWLRLSDPRRRYARYFRAHGDPASLWLCRAATGPDRARPLWARPEGADGCRGPSGRRFARAGVPLVRSIFRLPLGARPRKGEPMRQFGPIALVLLGLVLAAVPARAAGEQTLEIASKTGVHVFSVEIAENDAERAKGLMYRRELPEGRGMLFDFHRDQEVSFWMQNTYIPLDMIFIRGDGRILRIEENTEPLSTRMIPSRGAVRAVLEVIGGTSRKLGIAPGDRVASPIFKTR